jgi:hypothetical protein
MNEDLFQYYQVPPQAAATVSYTPISPEERRKRVAELNKRVAENIERLLNSSEFRNYLITMSRFHNYSWGNQILIWIQMPNATRVAGYNTWRDLGRFVKKGAKGIEILAPLGATTLTSWYRATDGVYWSIKRGEQKGWDIYDQEGNIVESSFPSYAAAARRLKELGFVEKKEALNVNYFKVVHVFDLSQTEGKPLPQVEVPALSRDANEELSAALLDLAEREGVEVSFDRNTCKTTKADGFFRPPKYIWICPTRSPADQLNALLHEVSHYFTEEVMRIPRADAETIAECSACVVGAYFGFDTGVSSFPYVAIWAKDPKVLHANLDHIQKVADKIIKDIEERKGRLLPMAWRSEIYSGKEIGKPDATSRVEISERRPLNLEALYPLKEVQDLARRSGINPYGRSKRELISLLAKKGVIK